MFSYWAKLIPPSGECAVYEYIAISAIVGFLSVHKNFDFDNSKFMDDNSLSLSSCARESAVRLKTFAALKFATPKASGPAAALSHL
jgi:hypothetical protein